MRTRVFSIQSGGAIRFGALALLSLVMLGVALADEADPPGRVARLSYVQGSVSLEPAGAQDWIPAELNRPLTTSDRLWSDSPGSRAELDIGGAVIRLGSDTGFSFLDLDDNIAQMQVTAGTVSVTVRELLENQTYEIDTPNVAVLLDQAGQYRVDVNEAGNVTVVRVSAGAAEANGGGQTIPIAAQQVMTFSGTQAIADSLGAPDGFDDWTFERDSEYEQAASRQYVPEDMAGTEDLDDNGQWANTPDYGYVWIPAAVAGGWAPYRAGHWAWISPWGWTWVDNASWGFAPFHYGRWTRWRNSWCWVPGPRQARAVYSPAMVGWVGGGAGVAASAPGARAGAGVSWFPLGPREVYVPSYRVSERYVTAINVANTALTDRTYITSVYQNRAVSLHYVNSAVPGAVTSAPQSVFVSARQLANGGARRPPPALMNRVVVARAAPPVSAGVRVRVVGSPRGVARMTPMPSPPAPGDNRSWAERARALGHSTLPPAQTSGSPPQSRANAAQAREYNDEANRLQQQEALQERSNENYRPSAGGASGGAVGSRDDRPREASQPGASQPGEVEQDRSPGNYYVRPQGEGRSFSAPGIQQPAGTRYVAPPPRAPAQVASPPPAPVLTPRLPGPPPAPVPTMQAPPTSPVHSGGPPQQHAPSTNQGGSAPRAMGRGDPPR